MKKEKIGGIIYQPTSGSEWVDLKEPIDLARYTISSPQFNEKWITALTDESLEEFKTKPLGNEIEENIFIKSILCILLTCRI